MIRYGPQSCPSTRRGAAGRDGSPVDPTPVEGASLAPVSGSVPTISRHDPHSPSGASGGSGRPHRGQRRDRLVTVSDMTSLGSSEARCWPTSASARVQSRGGGHLDQTEPLSEVTRSAPG